MEANRFDRWTRARTADASSRRSVIGGVLVTLLTPLSSLNASAGKGGGGKGKDKKKKKKPPCYGIVAHCGHSQCGLGEACCGQYDCDCKQNLYCNITDPSSGVGTCGCLPGEELVNGRCGTKPDCIPAGGRRGFFDKLCCSGSQHTEGPDDAPYDVCDAGDLVCLSDGDCTGGSCRGYACYAPELDCDIYYRERR